MNSRFVQYLGFKGISQSELSELSCVPKSTVSRFCSGHAVGSDKLLKMLQVCDDLSLEWLLYNTGDMIRSLKREVNIINNNGRYAGADVAKDNSTIIKSSPGVSFGSGYLEAELRRLLAEKDAVISERDRTITRLQELLSR